MPVSKLSSVNWPERCKVGAFDNGSLAGIYPLASRSGRPDMTMREYVRADVHEQQLADVRHALAWALTYIGDDAPESGEAREDYTGATRLAWPDSPEQWAPENAS